MTHPTALLASYAAGTLPDGQARQVAGHLTGCAGCATEAAAWHRVADAVADRVAAVAVPPAGLLDAVLARLSADGEPVARPEPVGSAASGPRGVPRYAATPGGAAGSRALRLLARQWRLVDWRVWPVAGVVLAFGTGVAAWAPPALSGGVLAMVVPLVAALAVAAACGSGADPAAELVAASPTGVRTVLLARLSLVLGVIVGAASVASLGLGWFDVGSSPARLFVAWLGPVALLSAVSFTLSVLWRPAIGIGAAISLWGLRALAGTGTLDNTVLDVVEPLWRTSGPVLAGAALLVAGAVALSPHRPGRSVGAYGW
ncbi:zf-HC2 domain-containing protein [Plantactinospora sp. B5E13]|uniref:zf-HC2 domain-containing protein n=1 Tax=unclassified Plantactinospora TaxID=2631981 RepID=UPI00325D39B5